LPFPTLDGPENSEITWLQMLHVLILGTCCKNKKNQDKDKVQINVIKQHAPIYIEELKFTKLHPREQLSQ
jgi:hypothetical protein